MLSINTAALRNYFAKKPPEPSSNPGQLGPEASMLTTVLYCLPPSRLGYFGWWWRVQVIFHFLMAFFWAMFIGLKKIVVRVLVGYEPTTLRSDALYYPPQTASTLPSSAHPFRIHLIFNHFSLKNKLRLLGRFIQLFSAICEVILNFLEQTWSKKWG